MTFLEELRWRGMLQDTTPGLEAVMAAGPITAYIGFDPTAPSLTIGNYVQLMLLGLLQKHGHHPIMLMGGATGRIGDPSGKDKERELKSFDILDGNLERQLNQARNLLRFDGVDNPVRIVNNIDHYRDMNVLAFLRDVGKTLTVNYMMSKESVKRRLDSGISYTEFSYQLLQAYDFQRLYQSHDCTLQLGGSDQWGNITSGIEFIRRNLGAKAYGATTPLLTKSDGRKFGKSEQGNIWLDGDMTTPYQFYQFWINADDADLSTFIRYFSMKEPAAIEEQDALPPQESKRMLAEELTRRLHGDAAYQRVLKVSELLFNRKADESYVRSLDIDDLSAAAKEITSFNLPKALVMDGVDILALLSEHTDITTSSSEARRAIKGNAISLNKVKVSDYDQRIHAADLLQGQYLMIENGKKNKYLIRLQ